VTPKVSFVVPCYELAHFLAECVKSILAQTYTDFEILIMDDCSPDNTTEVAMSFQDPRIRCMRNAKNLGHLRNYNRGIELATGEYVWLISADDVVWDTHALARYVDLLDQHPSAGFAFCAALELREGRTKVATYSSWQGSDGLLYGKNVFERLVYANTIVACSGMVRKAIYIRHGSFPLDMPYSGDWYLWCLFAMFGDVVFVADPLVAYRIHGASMTDTLSSTRVRQCADDDLAVLSALYRRAEAAGLKPFSEVSMRALGYEYARQLRSKTYRSVSFQRSPTEVAKLIRAFSQHKAESRQLMAYTQASLGDLHLEKMLCLQALKSYVRALYLKPFRLSVWGKLILVGLGRPGQRVRSQLSRWRSGQRDQPMNALPINTVVGG